MAEPKEKKRTLVIPAPKFEYGAFRIEGTTPYMHLRMSEKAMGGIRRKHEAGGTAKRGIREARNFDADYEAAKHISRDGWIGIPASAFRAAMISACRLVGFKMTLAKLTITVEADGYDRVDGMPLIAIEGTPEPSVMPVRNATGVIDLRSRPLWHEWSAEVHIRWNADHFTVEDIANLMMHVGMSVGIGEGRPDSKNSAGIGFGMFKLVGMGESRAVA